MDAGVGDRGSRGGLGGVTLLDGVALVAGAAIAAVHLRDGRSARDLPGAGWALVWLTFAGVAVTASGPFLRAIRRLSGRPGTPPRLGDRLWALLGAPWVVAALPKIVGDGDGAADLYGFTLVVGIGLASLVNLAVVWSRWVMRPGHVPADDDEGGWTHKVGLVLAVAWPVQCGLGLVVLGAQG